MPDYGAVFWKGDDNQFVNIHDELERKLDLDLTSLSQDETAHNDPPGITQGEEFQALVQQNPLYQLLAQDYHLQSNLRLHLPLSNGASGCLVLWESRGYAFTDGDFSLLQTLVPQLSLTFDNLFAFEHIGALKRQVEQEKTYLLDEIKASGNFEDIIGSSGALQQVFQQVSQVAPTDATVLILGESGTGKELIARALHNQSPRRDRTLMKVNCAALPAQLIESELFGHEKGSFTGAFERRLGKFELANGGTVFLDEIGELPLELQAKLLRVLQEREIERLGGKAPIKVDVRILAATNRDLLQEVQQGRFRLDLYYRLNVFPIQLPPLRERRDDIPLLATYFGQRFSRQLNRPFRGIKESALNQLLAYNWPGNIRELENLIEQAVIISTGQQGLEWGRPLINPAPLPAPAASLSTPSPAPAAVELSPELRQMVAVLRETKGKVVGPDGAAQRLGVRPHLLEEAERHYFLEVLAQTGGRIRGEGGAADLLGVKPTTLESRMERLGIRKAHIVQR